MQPKINYAAKTENVTMEVRGLKKVLVSLPVVILVAVLFCTRVFAQSTEIKTSVPDYHTVIINIEGCGEVIADGKSVDGEISVERLKQQEYILSPAEGYILSQVICDGEDVTALVRDNVFIADAINHDTELKIIFTAAADESKTTSEESVTSRTSCEESDVEAQSKDESTDTSVSKVSSVSDSTSEISLAAGSISDISEISGSASEISSASVSTLQISKAQVSDGDKKWSVTTGDVNTGMIFLIILSASCVLIFLCIRKQKSE